MDIERPDERDRLDKVVVELGLVTQEQIAAAEPARAGGQRLGEALIAQGALDKAKLAQALQTQLERKTAAVPEVADLLRFLASNEFGEIRRLLS